MYTSLPLTHREFIFKNHSKLCDDDSTGIIGVAQIAMGRSTKKTLLVLQNRTNTNTNTGNAHIHTLQLREPTGTHSRNQSLHPLKPRLHTHVRTHAHIFTRTGALAQSPTTSSPCADSRRRCQQLKYPPHSCWKLRTPCTTPQWEFPLCRFQTSLATWLGFTSFFTKK